MAEPSGTKHRRSFPDVLAGAIFVVIGAAFAVGALGYGLGTPLRMGPGAFPMLVGVALGVMGLAIVGKGLVAGEVAAFGRVPWRAVVVIVVAVVFFGFTVRDLGFVPASAVTTLLCTLARPPVRPLMALAVTAGLTAAATLIFIYGLQLSLPLYGPWLGF